MNVTFLPAGRTVEVLPEESVFETAVRHRIPIQSVCMGKATCASCRVRVVEGMQNTKRPCFDEKTLLGNTWFITRERLACRLFVTGDVTVDVAETE